MDIPEVGSYVAILWKIHRNGVPNHMYQRVQVDHVGKHFLRAGGVRFRIPALAAEHRNAYLVKLTPEIFSKTKSYDAIMEFLEEVDTQQEAQRESARRFQALRRTELIEKLDAYDFAALSIDGLEAIDAIICGEWNL